MNWTPEQHTIFEHPASRNLIINAVAGSGKTSTIIELAKRQPRHLASTFLAFNKEIATTLGTRLPYYCKASTFHSFCLTALRACRPDLEINFDKTKDILAGLVGNKSERFAMQSTVIKLVSRCKSQLQPDIESVAERFDLDCTSRMLHLAEEVLMHSNGRGNEVDFDDMLLFALDPDITFAPVDLLFVDESQDTNEVQREILLKLATEPKAGQHQQLSKTRFIFVGDPHQSIYGFRGADSAAMELLTKAFNCDELPLSVSWRCSQAVVAEARKFL